MSDTQSHNKSELYKCVSCGHEVKNPDLASIRCPKCHYKGLEYQGNDLRLDDAQSQDKGHEYVANSSEDSPNTQIDGHNSIEDIMSDTMNGLCSYSSAIEALKERESALIQRENNKARIDELRNIDLRDKGYSKTVFYIEDRLEALNKELKG